MLDPRPTATQEECTGKAREKNRSEDDASSSSGTLRANARSFCGETKIEDGGGDAAIAVMGSAEMVLVEASAHTSYFNRSTYLSTKPEAAGTETTAS